MSVDLVGAVDMHVHFGPDPGRIRRVSGTEAVAQAAAAGHAGLVLKSHDAPTAQVAAALTDSSAIAVFGSVCCDVGVGGLNVVAVGNALAIGAKVVWLPTFSSTQDWDRHGRHRDVPWPGIAVCDDAGELVPDAASILHATFAAGAVVATGHISIVEHLAVARSRPEHGKVVVTHARETLCGPGDDMTIEVLEELVALGAVIEFCALTCIGALATREPAEVAAVIRRIGPEHSTIASDFGQEKNEPPVIGLAAFADALHACGLTEHEIRTMAVDNPRRLVGLES
ncbi:MAG TPA: DUF6282 family protein, partial [Ilumatobacteraceae bacterium]|nr:DUF6282 family protein [Ilumatobacteraceae bacterium]